MITLYHGTDIYSAKSICKTGIDFTIENSQNDFGPGFYLTPNKETAFKRAKKKALWRNTKAAIVVILFDDTEANIYTKHFKDDFYWAQFIMNNRNGTQYSKTLPYKNHNLDRKYDITYGRIADIEVINFADELLKAKRMLTDQEISRILNPSYAMQYALHTEFCLQFIKKISYREVF